MELGNATMLESSSEVTMLTETVKSIVPNDERNETEGNFFLVSQTQNEQYSQEDVEQTSTLYKEETLAWTQLCRICANATDQMIPIFEGEGVQHDLSNKILKYLPIHISETDTLPLQLCFHCTGILLAWHELCEGCLNAEKRLLEMQDALQNKYQYCNPTSSDNLEVTAATVTIASNTTDSPPEQQVDEGNDAEENISNRKINSRPTSHHIYSWKAHKILVEECRSKISSIRTKMYNVVDENLKNDFSSTNNIACILTKHSSRTNNTFSKVLHLSAKSTNNEKKNKDKVSARKTHTSCVKEKNAQEERIIEVRESDACLEDDIKQSKLEKVASTNLMMICKVCNKKFRSRKSYWAHVRKHSGGKSYICHICGKQYFQNGSLYYHLKHMHDGVKNHACDICGRSFAMKTAMEDHRRIHTGERPYVCDSCGKTFKTKASLYIHSKTHTDELPHKCIYCSKRFRWKQRMLGHLTMHTGEKNHTCDVCGKGFGVKNDLTRHKRIHSDEKPYTCQQCGISFGQKRYLRNHERSKLGMCGQNAQVRLVSSSLI